MSVLLYKGAKYRTLAGKKIFRNGKWIELPASAKMYLDGQWYPLGRTVPGSSIPDIPDMPEVPEITHINGEEPSGKKWYISPAGAGAQDGSSWSNAAPVSDIHIIMLQAVSGDSVYLMEGSYTTNRVISVPEGVNFYGGFSAENPQWSTRNGFDTPTVFTGTGDFACFVITSSGQSIEIDGVSLYNFSRSVDTPYYDATFNIQNARIQNTPCYCTKISHAVVDDSEVVNTAYADYCVFSNASVRVIETLSYCYCTKASGSYSTVMSCSFIDCTSEVDVEITNTAVFNGKYSGSANMSNCTISNVEMRGMGQATVNNCTITNSKCTADKKSTFIMYTMDKSTVYNCTFSPNYCAIGNSSNNCFVECLIEKGAEHVNVGSNDFYFLNSSQKDTFVNCSSAINEFAFIYHSAIQDKIYNCFAYGKNAHITIASINKNCLFVNCESQFQYIIKNNDASIHFCTFVNCQSGNDVAKVYTALSCLSFNNATNTGEFIAKEQLGCAGSLYSAGNKITLGYDNTIARFTATGYFPARGVQDVGKCPNPATDRAGFDAYIAAFGDWRPLSNSFLVGQGNAFSDITTDLNDVTRPDPPTIGAYEPKPE